MKYKKLLHRSGHSAAMLTVNSDCVEVILFGGFDEGNSLVAETTILRFCECLNNSSFFSHDILRLSQLRLFKTSNHIFQIFLSYLQNY